MRYWWVLLSVQLCWQLSECKTNILARELPEDDLPDTNDLKPNTGRAMLKKIRLSLEQYYNRLRNENIYGLCIVRPSTLLGEDESQQITGTVDFKQSLNGGQTSVRVNLTGFDPEDSIKLHGFHVHEFGDLSGGCDSSGGHYNPFGVVHGAPDDSPEFRHFGDLGNVEEDEDGNVEEEMSDYLVSLLGPFSILGRAIVVHAGVDDLGRGENDASLANGNAGSRLACCIIGLSDGQHWEGTL